MLNNLFIIDSPLQLLNAIEAREYFKTSNNILVVIFYKNHNQRHRAQVNNILGIYDWDKVLIVDSINARSKFFQILSLIKKLKQYNYNYIFCGNISKSQNAIITSVEKNEVCLIDDGVATINIYAEGKVTNFGNKLKDKFKLLRYKLFGITIESIENMSFFSTLNLTGKDDIKVIKNEYRYLRSRSNQYNLDTETVYIVGQNFVKVNSLTDEQYIAYLKKIKNIYNDKKIVYLPHREESINDKYKEVFDENFKLVYFDNNIELEFILKNIYPATVIGFISSALTTIKSLFPKTDIVSLKPNSKILQERFAHVYDYFEKDGIKVELL